LRRYLGTSQPTTFGAQFSDSGTNDIATALGSLAFLFPTVPPPAGF